MTARIPLHTARLQLQLQHGCAVDHILPALAAFLNGSSAPWPLAIRETMAAMSHEEQDAFFTWIARQRFPAATIARLKESARALGFD